MCDLRVFESDSLSFDDDVEKYRVSDSLKINNSVNSLNEKNLLNRDRDCNDLNC